MTTQAIAEKIILRSFCKEPFHSLFFIYKIVPDSFRDGGTCSDKVLSVKEELEKEGFKVKLHSSFINGNECHQLLKIWIDKNVFFADVGNAWPSIKLFSADKITHYKNFGIEFRTKVFSDCIKIYQTRNGITRDSVCIPLQPKSESQIFDDIKTRFDCTDNFPFADKFRFAQIIKKEFLFIRDNELHRYTNSSYKKEPVFNHQETLMTEFGFDLPNFLKNHGK